MKHMVGSCTVVCFAPQEMIAENLQVFADEFFAVVTINYRDDGRQQLCGYMRPEADEKQMHKAADEQALELPEYKIEVLQSKDWLAENVIKFAPVVTPDFFVYGVHEKNIQVPQDKIGIKIYAATAFGSEHQTTKSCLQAISDINASGIAVRHVLDMGTGSGILALAAAKIWPDAKVVAVDIDDEAVAVAKQNAIDNRLERQIVCAHSDGYNSTVIGQNALYDVIFANILARPLIAMAPDMAKNLRQGGYAVISGFIEDQVDWVLAAHTVHGLRLEKIYALDGWQAALLRKE